VWALSPTAFSAIFEALDKLICTCDSMLLVIVGPTGTEPVIFGP
jgi:hypothetical protein